jgi:hypothetical protein
MKYVTVFLRDTHKNQKNEREKTHYIIVTFDLKGATDANVYKAIDQKFNDMSLRKYVKVPDELIDLPRNTYASLALKSDYENINRLRDNVEKAVKDILEFHLKYGEIEGFAYFVFVAGYWSWAAGSKNPLRF